MLNTREDYKNVAKEAIGGSPVMRGRNKITVDEVISRFPSGITITEFDLIGDGDDSYPVFAFAEDNGLYMNGGAIAKSIVDAWIDKADGSISDASDGLKACGGVKFIIGRKKTKDGKNITTFDVVD